ncbi:uncharacterized protein B0J16DRAFT_97657 [Fusarium flagelliforme]|uniref:Zn(2)-C6 fungal-type domain-containing protein n=1 Tax=Fusarium flagelliforme TaxID=2675880 RepID=A0A395MDP0_9HYPO|nr:uncharacterized protein B0J16DRAFT_97657 [Fusarium flagelliforme]KAH7188608.1 hypothetical protein B0J16DRAFT_97657 [Fusarium flagelliforme]RFN45985.1 hypothetical protein FIE12Z_9792 [Fusarium flagelliforme]
MASMSPLNTTFGASGPSSNDGSVSPQQTVTPKTVAFELTIADSPEYRARLPMRVKIYPHDTTDSIVTTVKNFYGLYSGPTGSKGVSFEDYEGNTLIARYENFQDRMVVYVRVIEESPANSSAYAPRPYHDPSMSGHPYYSDNGYPAPQASRFTQEMSRPNSRSSRRRSPSPNTATARGRRSASASTNGKKGRSRSSKTRASASRSHTELYSDSINGYSSNDEHGSTSGKNKDQIPNPDISMDNIVEGGRRKRAKFESSELPLFAPPQMPAATSNPSVSPARRAEPHRPAMPFVQPHQNPFTNPPRPMQSPQGYGSGITHPSLYSTPGPDARRNRNSGGYASSAMGILPTPDPTVGSCVSEEDKDVAIQLMRLGDMSNISHGRTSASTLDDTFSGRADAASSTGATSDGDSESEAELPPPRRQKLDMAGVGNVYQTTESHFMPPPESAEVSGDDADYEDGADDSLLSNGKSKPAKTMKAPSKHKSLASISKTASNKTSKTARPINGTKGKKLPPVPSGPMSPASMPPSRKQSVASTGQTPLAPGEDDQPDLSTKPRCQRCRKSKKGCDRQRPCGRCRDAGLTADQCISEDEGNGRKGRYGRHMGVPIAKDEVPAVAQPALLPAAPIAAAMAGDKSKKRKR